MINVLINERKGIIKVEGHAGFDVKGQDIVCAGVSAITNGVVGYFEKVQKAESDLKKEDEKQFVTKITVSEKKATVRIAYDVENFSNFLIVKNVFELMYEQFVEEEYKDYVNVEVIEKNARTKNQFR